jgi:hypothetical protein
MIEFYENNLFDNFGPYCYSMDEKNVCIKRAELRMWSVGCKSRSQDQKILFKLALLKCK